MRSRVAFAAATVAAFVLAAAQFINIVDFVIVMPLGERLMKSLEISPLEFGLIVSSYTFSAALAGLLSVR